MSRRRTKKDWSSSLRGNEDTSAGELSPSVKFDRTMAGIEQMYSIDTPALTRQHQRDSSTEDDLAARPAWDDNTHTNIDSSLKQQASKVSPQTKKTSQRHKHSKHRSKKQSSNEPNIVSNSCVPASFQSQEEQDQQLHKSFNTTKRSTRDKNHLKQQLHEATSAIGSGQGERGHERSQSKTPQGQSREGRDQDRYSSHRSQSARARLKPDLSHDNPNPNNRPSSSTTAPHNHSSHSHHQHASISTSSSSHLKKTHHSTSYLSRKTTQQQNKSASQSHKSKSSLKNKNKKLTGKKTRVLDAAGLRNRISGYKSILANFDKDWEIRVLNNPTKTKTKTP